MRKESFVSYRSFHEALKELTREQYGNVMFAINEYALNQEEIELSGVEKIAFTLIKPQLDANIKRQENGKYGSLGGRPRKEENQKQNTGYVDKNPMGNLQQENKNPNVNDNVNVNVNDNDNVNANVNLPTGYAKQIFNLYKELGLPCCNGNEALWESTEFGKAYDTLQRYYKGLHSNDLMAAIRNYSSILKDERVYSGYKKSIKSFSRFVSWDRFTDFLPCSFDINKFTNWSEQKPEKKTVGANRAIEILREVQSEQKRIPE